jgi:hemolysin activation/secretion protein
MRIPLLLLLLPLLIINNGDLYAQDISGVDPGAVREGSKDAFDFYRLEKRLREPGDADSKKTSVEDKTGGEKDTGIKDDERTIYISRIETGPSEIISAGKLKEITERYEGRNITISELFKAVREINEVYAAQKFIAARAVLPEQKVEKGVVRIKLIESHAGKITVEDNKYIKDSFFTKRISLKSGDLIRIDRLEKDIFYLNNTNDVSARVEIKAGETAGTTDCIIKAKEPERYQLTMFSDNAGRDTVGLYRLGMMFTAPGLLGYADQLNISAFTSEHSSTTAWSGSYSYLLNRFGTRMALSYDKNQIKVISGAFETLNISGDSYDLGTDINHPLIVEPALRVNLFTGLHFTESTTDFDGEPLYSTGVTNLNLGFNFQSFDSRGSWYTSHRLTRGVTFWGGDVSFLKYNFLISRQLLLGENTFLVFNGRTQITGSNMLPSSEQFQVGGSTSVRGFPEGFLIGDEGYMANLEFYFPVVPAGSGGLSSLLNRRLKGTLFIDHGEIFKNRGNADGRIRGAGIGLLIKYSKYFTGRLNLGIPLTDRDTLEDKYQVHFMIQSRPF